MAIYSMTAFARCNAQTAQGGLIFEIRSVNHRYFDCSMKLPERLKSLEVELRDKLRHAIVRGRIDCSLQYQPLISEATPLLALNTDMIKELARACTELKQYFKVKGEINPLQVLSWSGVIQSAPDNLDELKAPVFKLFEQALTELIASRAREGAVLAKLLQDKLRDISTKIAQIKLRIPLVIDAQKAKLQSKLAEIKQTLDEGRLEQEMVYFIQRIDINEEIERLETHIAAMQKVLEVGGAVGKRLDFLLQECNRETNTIASKSADAQISSIAVDMKVSIEQIREQVQNIE